jgi:hypothetical protein
VKIGRLIASLEAKIWTSKKTMALLTRVNVNGSYEGALRRSQEVLCGDEESGSTGNEEPGSVSFPTSMTPSTSDCLTTTFRPQFTTMMVMQMTGSPLRNEPGLYTTNDLKVLSFDQSLESHHGSITINTRYT